MTRVKGAAQQRLQADIVDLEARVREDDHQSLRVWLRILSCTRAIQNHIRERLRTEFDTSLSRFDFMAQLDRVPEGLKMSELSQRLMVTGGNVTGIADALEHEGLITRESDPTDGRVYRIKLTRTGRRRFEKMARAHEGWVVELFEPLTDREKQTLITLLGNVRAHLRRREAEAD